jgi:hypothetical protein
MFTVVTFFTDNQKMHLMQVQLGRYAAVFILFFILINLL